MHFLKFPAPLWFLAAGTGTDIQKTASLNAVVSIVADTSIAFEAASGSAITKLVSGAYNVSVSTQDVTSVQIEMSGISYKISASASASILAYVEADSFNVQVSITPIYTLQQSGQANKSVEASYNLSISGATGSIASYLSVAGSYSLSVAPAISASASETFSVSAAYAISLSTSFNLGVTQGNVSKSIADQYPISLSATVNIVIDKGGGLVWGRRKKRYYPHKIGYPLR